MELTRSLLIGCRAGIGNEEMVTVAPGDLITCMGRKCGCVCLAYLVSFAGSGGWWGEVMGIVGLRTGLGSCLWEIE